jgi:uncharacterized protein YdaU (DUF1376 family)
MAELPYMPIVVSDTIAETGHLTNEELGALLRIQWAMWMAGGLLDLDQLPRYARAGKRWGAISRAIFAKLLVIDGKVSSPEITELLARTRDRRRRKAEAGRAGGLARSEGRLNATSAGRPNERNALKSYEAGGRSAWPALGQSKSKEEYGTRDSMEQRASVPPPQGTGDAELVADAAVRKHALNLLMTEGLEDIAQRRGVTKILARRMLNQWLLALDQDPHLLVTVLGDAAALGLTGERFEHWMGQQVRSLQLQRRAAKQRELPLAPMLVKRSGAEEL